MGNLLAFRLAQFSLHLLSTLWIDLEYIYRYFFISQISKFHFWLPWHKGNRYTPQPGTSVYLSKNNAIKLMMNSISMRKTESLCEKKFFVTFGTCEKIEVKRGHLVKKWEFGQMKKILIYQFIKTRICAFMTYDQFPPKSSSNLRFVIRDSRVRDPRVQASNPWISDDKSQIWATFRQKLTIGHKSTYSSFENFIYWNFFHLTKFSLFDQVASFDLDFLASPKGYE